MLQQPGINFVNRVLQSFGTVFRGREIQQVVTPTLHHIEDPSQQSPPKIEDVQSKMPRLQVSGNAFERLMGLYERKASAKEFQVQILQHYSIEEIISSLNQVPLLILQEPAFVLLSTRIDKIREWIRFMTSLRLFDMEIYHLSLGYALECLHKCLIAQMLEHNYPEQHEEFKLRYVTGINSHLNSVADLLELIDNLGEYISALEMGIELRKEFDLQPVPWWGSETLSRLAWRSQKGQEQYNGLLAQLIMIEFSFYAPNDCFTILTEMFDFYQPQQICEWLLQNDLKFQLLRIHLTRGYGFEHTCTLLSQFPELCKNFVDMAVTLQREDNGSNIVNTLAKFQGNACFEYILHHLQKYPKLLFVVQCKTMTTRGGESVPVSSFEGQSHPIRWFLFMQNMSRAIEEQQEIQI